MADARRLAEAAIPPDLARELAAQVTAGVGNRTRLVELGMVPRLAAEVTSQIGTSGDARRLVELGLPPVAAREMVVQFAGGVVSGLTLNVLTLSNNAATAGTPFTAMISGLTTGSTRALTGAGSSGLTISGTTISGTPTTSGAVNVIETLAGYTNSPRTSAGVLSVGVTTGSVTLNALLLSSTALATGSPISASISNKNSSSTVAATSSDGTALTVAGPILTGTFTTPGTPTVTLVETLSGATGSPRTSSMVLNLTAAGPATAALTLMGDSIVAGTGASPATHVAAYMMGYGTNVTILNKAQSGENAQTAQTRWNNGDYNAGYVSDRPSFLIIESGTNSLANFGGNISAEALYAIIADIVGKAKAKGFYVLVCTILPREMYGNDNWSDAQEAKRISYNNMVRANGFGADGIIDQAGNPVIGDAANVNAPAKGFYGDGLHPSNAGQEALTPTWRAALDMVIGSAIRLPSTGNGTPTPTPTPTPSPTPTPTPTATGTAWDPARKNAALTLVGSPAREVKLAGSGGWYSVLGTIFKSGGKLAVQWKNNASAAQSIVMGIGNANATITNYPGSDANSTGGWDKGQYLGGSGGTIAAVPVGGTAVDVYDLVNMTMQRSVNGGALGTPHSFTFAGPYTTIASFNTGPAGITMAWGAADWDQTYPIPSGSGAVYWDS